MNKTTCVFATLFATIAASAATITAETGLDLVDAATLPDEVYTAEDGATIRVSGSDASRPGLWLHKDERVDGLAQMRRLHDPVQGRDYGGRTNLVYDSLYTNTAAIGTWDFQGRWYAPSTGLYSFAAAFDDRIGLVIDGRSIVAAEWSTLKAAQDVFLAEGWHDVQISLVNDKGGMGPAKTLSKGLVWSADNLAFTEESIDDGNLFDDPGDGSRLQQVHNGAFCRKLSIPSGTATLDLTQCELAGTFCFGAYTGLQTGEGSKLLVRGATNLVFNGLDNGGVHYPFLDADIEFADDPAGKVHIVGKASIERMRPNYVIEDGSDIAYWGTNMVTDSEWVLTNRNAQLISDKAISSETKIVVAEGSLLVLKPCQHRTGDVWLWQGIAGTYANDFEVYGESGEVILRDYRNLELSGRVSGDGVISAMDAPQDNPARLTGDLSDFNGTFRVYEHGRLSVEGVLPTNGVSKINLGYLNKSNGGVLFFKPEGAGEEETSVSVARSWGCQTNAWVEAVAKQEITIGTFGGTGGLKTANLTDSHITVESLDADATLVLRYRANVTVNSIGAGAKIAVVGSSEEQAKLTLGGETNVLDVLDVDAGAILTLAGTGTVVSVTGSGTVVLEGGVTIQNVGPNVSLRMVSNAVVRDNDPVALASALGTKPALWLDASRTDTMQQYLNCVFTNGIVVRRWNDCRPGQTGLYGLNPRGEGYSRVYPYVMTNALNGMDVVSMGAVGGQIESKYGHVNTTTGEPVDDLNTLQPETRRLPFNKPITVRTAIIVFGSQFGGGGAIIGGDTDQGVKDLRGTESSEWVKPATSCSFARGTTNVNDYKKPGTKIFKDYRKCWLNGVSVDPTKTGYNGEWQIVAFESKTDTGEEVRSLGMIDGYQNSGGQNYAEVLLYTNALTTAERQAVELYLARKWGIGAKSLPLNGSGLLEVVGILPAEGSFAGTVTVAAGGCVDLGAFPAPMTEAEMPTEGRVGWFDPDYAASVELAGAGEAGKEDCIYGIFDRGKARESGTAYLHGTYNSQSSGGSGDRRPRAVFGAHGDGPARTWVNFYEDPSDGGGNTLRVKTNPSFLRKNNPPDYSNTTLSTRTAFIVCDSTYGGGNPIGDTVKFDELVKRRDVDKFEKPIWKWGTDGSITNGETRLNGQVVNGSKQGFTGGAELLSFTTTNAFPAAFFGSCGTGANERSYEQLGEMLLFSREIVGEERDRIEAYLMNKWLGFLPSGLCDWRRATVAGAGTVKAPSKDVLPQFAPDFAGTLDLAGDLSFHVDATNVVTDAVTLPATATLELPATGTLSVSFEEKAVSCVLATAGSITGFNTANWTLQVSPSTRGIARLECTDGVLRLVVLPTGTQIFIR